MILVKVKLVMEVVVVLKMVLMEVDHAMNVEGNREAAKLANWFTKRSVMTSSVTSLSTLLASFSTTLSINWSITIPNTTSPHLRCHKNSQAIWRSSVGLPGSPVVFMSQKSVFSETPCNYFLGAIKRQKGIFFNPHYFLGYSDFVVYSRDRVGKGRRHEKEG